MKLSRHKTVLQQLRHSARVVDVRTFPAGTEHASHNQSVGFLVAAWQVPNQLNSFDVSIGSSADGTNHGRRMSANINNRSFINQYMPYVHIYCIYYTTILCTSHNNIRFGATHRGFPQLLKLRPWLLIRPGSWSATLARAQWQDEVKQRRISKHLQATIRLY